MSETVIRVENLSKLYRLGELHKQTNSFRDKVSQAFSRLTQRAKSQAQSVKPSNSNTPRQALGAMRNSPNSMRYALCAMQAPDDDVIWALKDVSFEVKQGEVLGIIGRNGAGKSTLLKVLSRITKPTEGKAWINGRVGSLLEVGTGFHPELTGRENIYLNGAILGMRKAEISRKFDEIVGFAEIEKFIDTPVKRYSSGMYVRLAFAVAAHLEPDILFVDEVLAVGDFAFQKKCLGKMQQISGLGRTVLFVSHNLMAIKGLCKSCLLLDSGCLSYLGNPGDCVKRYQAGASHEDKSEVDVESRKRVDVIGNELRFTKVRLRSSGGGPTVRLKEPLVLDLEFSVLEPLSDVVLGFSIYSSDQVQVLQCLSTSNGNSPIRHLAPDNYMVVCTIPENLLAPGRYTVELGARNDKRQQDEVPDALQFEILDTETYESPWIAPVRGYFRLPSQWTSPERLEISR